jgi:UDP-N-acetyl-2-amino-2-deoxyglucuronate dehydrogenase
MRSTPSSDKPLRFAIAGCGRIAQRHAEHIQKVGRLVAVCDVVPERANTLAARTDARPYHSLELLLEAERDLDVVSICTPNGLHAEHSIRVLKAGHHVLCEKPLATTVHDCAEMIRTAEHANKRLFAVKQNRFNPPVVAVKNAIDQGKLGRIYGIQLTCFWNRNEEYYRDSWKGTKAMDGGTLFTQFSHFIDLLYWMFGDVKRIRAFGANLAHVNTIEFEDSGVVALEFYNGALGTINYSVNSYKRNMEGSLTILGERGAVKIGGQYLNTLDYQEIEGYRIPDLPEGNTANSYGSYQGSMSNHDKVYENLVDVLQKDGAISANAFDAFKAVEIIARIYRAMSKNIAT